MSSKQSASKQFNQVKRIVELISEERRKTAKEIQKQYEVKHSLQKELFDHSIPYKRHKEASEMLDIINDLIADLALEVSVWDQAREIVFNVMEEAEKEQMAHE